MPEKFLFEHTSVVIVYDKFFQFKNEKYEE